jgi:hypothetical protein
MDRTLLSILVIFSTALSSAVAAESIFVRSYTEGQNVTYLMQGRNQDGGELHTYRASSAATVYRESDGTFFENVAWKNLVFDDQAVQLDPVSVAFRQQISLDPAFDATKHLPQQNGIDYRLRPASDDLMNFYVDLQLAAKLSMLKKSGDHFYLNYAQPTSYRNGQAETCVDFDVTVESVDSTSSTATVSVKHVPPAKACVKLSAPWMETPVSGDHPNNVIQTIPQPGGTFKITLGREEIDVDLKVDLTTGKILNGRLLDQFKLLDRICADQAGNGCGSPISYEQTRDITIDLQP